MIVIILFYIGKMQVEFLEDPVFWLFAVVGARRCLAHGKTNNYKRATRRIALTFLEKPLL